jgi:hypothetical protein
MDTLPKLVVELALNAVWLPKHVELLARHFGRFHAIKPIRSQRLANQPPPALGPPWADMYAGGLGAIVL